MVPRLSGRFGTVSQTGRGIKVGLLVALKELAWMAQSAKEALPARDQLQAAKEYKSYE